MSDIVGRRMSEALGMNKMEQNKAEIERRVESALDEALREIERLRAARNDRPRLGLATTGELLDELRARIELHALGGLAYRTVDGETFAESEKARRALEGEDE